METKLIVEDLRNQKQSMILQSTVLKELQDEQGRLLLRFEDISPKWAERFKDKMPTPLSLQWFKWYFELKRTSKCVVGEAYGYSSYYIHNCRECDDLGWRFMYYFTVRSIKKLQDNRDKFVIHWNKQHR